MDKADKTRQLINSLAVLYEAAVFNRLAEFLEGELRVLRALDMAGEPLNPSRLSEQLKVSRSRITAALSGLQRKGFVTLTAEESDRRRVLASPTAEGRRYVAERSREVEQYFSFAVGALGEKDVDELLRIIDKFANSIPKEIDS